MEWKEAGKLRCRRRGERPRRGSLPLIAPARSAVAFCSTSWCVASCRLSPPLTRHRHLHTPSPSSHIDLAAPTGSARTQASKQRSQPHSSPGSCTASPPPRPRPRPRPPPRYIDLLSPTSNNRTCRTTPNTHVNATRCDHVTGAERSRAEQSKRLPSTARTDASVHEEPALLGWRTIHGGLRRGGTWAR